jgi:hypothetical protein
MSGSSFGSGRSVVGASENACTGVTATTVADRGARSSGGRPHGRRPSSVSGLTTSVEP